MLSHTEVTNLKIYGETAELEFDGKKIAITHYPKYANALVRTGDYNAVFYGHNHTAKSENIESCLLANPGEILGAFEEPRFGIYDTETNAIEFVFVKNL